MRFIAYSSLQNRSTYFRSNVLSSLQISVLIICRLFILYNAESFQLVISCNARFICNSDLSSFVKIVIVFFFAVGIDCCSKNGLKYWLSLTPNECPNIVMSSASNKSTPSVGGLNLGSNDFWIKSYLGDLLKKGYCRAAVYNRSYTLGDASLPEFRQSRNIPKQDY